MFAIIPTGRPIQTNFEQVDSARWMVRVEDFNSIKSFTVALTAQVPTCPSDCAFTVYISPARITQWVYMGYISNEVPSAMFRVRCPVTETDDMLVGISIEPKIQIEQMESQKITPVSAFDNVVLNKVGNALVKNLRNYMGSFSIHLPDGVPGLLAPGDWVPMGALQRWNDEVERRVRLNPRFWESTEE